MVGRFGKGGLLKRAFGGIVEGLQDGGIGGGNLLRHIATNIVDGGGSGGGGSTSRAVPGTLDFSEALDYPPPDPLVTPIPGGYDDRLDLDMNEISPDAYERPDTNPRPTQYQRTDYIPYIHAGTVNPQAVDQPWGPNTFGGGGAIQYGGAIGPQPNPNVISPGVGTYTSPTTGTGCSCSRRKYTCEEKCAYNAQMKEQCKGCRSYFRKNKKWIYPKRKYYRKRYTPKRRYKSKYQNWKAGVKRGGMPKPGDLIKFGNTYIPYNPNGGPAPTYPGVIPPWQQ